MSRWKIALNGENCRSADKKTITIKLDGLDWIFFYFMSTAQRCLTIDFIHAEYIHISGTSIGTAFQWMCKLFR